TQPVLAALERRFAERGLAVALGVARYPEDGRSADALLDRAGARVRGADPDAHAAPIVAREGDMAQLQRLVERVARGSINVLVLGETGAGKEVLAEAIHRLSPRSAAPFLRLNCAALSETLLESELFGYERGAFTGAVAAKSGLLETAEGGTVFLDEVGELPMTTQVKLLRVLEDRTVLRVGGLKARPIDVRFIAATNRNLAAEVKRGAFRADLFYRLDGVALEVPPLRCRLGEIPDLARAFAAEAARKLDAPEPVITDDALALLQSYSWPGNIRELRNAMERAVLLSRNARIGREQLPLEKMRATVGIVTTSAPAQAQAHAPAQAPAPAAPAPAAPAPAASAPARPRARRGSAIQGDDIEQLRRQIDDLERERILAALERCGGNQTRAAKLLGMPRRTLVSRLSRYDVPRPRK
ncbi:MAG TPA: sigma-54 dependent transcriptional regulator, partial [Kofleriaceae bacterium]|nr:sigma-54 dependent transcriptional regulator [Kofleriaceae bacterium]